MRYKYSKKQIFSKKLAVPSDIQKDIYDGTLNFKDYIEYDLVDKIPETCLLETDLEILNKLGLEDAKKLDWELLALDEKLKNKILKLDIDTKEINEIIYEEVKDKVAPSKFSDKMKELYPEKIFIDASGEVETKFNEGKLTVEEMISNWDIVKEKDLINSLINDSKITEDVTDEIIKEFINCHRNLVSLINKYDDLYEFINRYISFTDFKERISYVKDFTDALVEKISSSYVKPSTIFSNEELKQLFKYSSLEQFLKKKTRALLSSTKLVGELRNLPINYVFNCSIPFDIIATTQVLSFIGEYGLKNVVDFDLECGNFFTNNKCEMLKLMYDMYLRYAGNENDPKKSIKTKSNYDASGRLTDRPYNKDEFYEAMRRMIVFGPSDRNYAKSAPDYRKMTGEFKKRYQELFIDDEAPEEFKKLFYTKSITPKVLKENPILVKYLEEKDLSSCFKTMDILVMDISKKTKYVKFYDYLKDKLSFDELMEFIIDYADVLEIVYDESRVKNSNYTVIFEVVDSLDDIKDKLDNALRKILIVEKVKYPKFIPEHLKKHYPDMFISDDAGNELTSAFYDRLITNEVLDARSEFIPFLKHIDLEILYPYMPCVYKKSTGKEIDNIVVIIEKIFGHNEAFEMLREYGNYINIIFENNISINVEFNEFENKEDFLKEIDYRIYNLIVDGNIKYNDKLPQHFKDSHPTLFLDENVEKEIKERFYNRDFIKDDFEKYPELFNIFNNTNIACGLNIKYSWAIPLLDGDNNLETNHNKLDIINEYEKVEDYYLKDEFIRYFEEIKDDINQDKISNVSKIMNRLAETDSYEMFTFRRALAYKLLRSEDPFELLTKVESSFTSSNLPTVIKVLNSSKILYSDDYMPVSKEIISSDLVRANLGSNNRVFKRFLKELNKYQKIFEEIRAKRLNIEYMDEADRDDIWNFRDLLLSLYNSSLSRDENEYIISDSVENDITLLAYKISPNSGLDYNIADRIVSLYCHNIGIDTVDAANIYINKKVTKTNEKNRRKALSRFELKRNDLVRGIGDVTYLKNILQNGLLSKEFLGECGDNNPYGVEFSKVINVDGTMINTISKLNAGNYGPIYVVVKNDTRFTNQIDDPEEEIEKIAILNNDKTCDLRTGIASSEIDFLIMNEYDPRVGLEIAMNGFYIPVVDAEGVVVFAPKDYDEIRDRMQGLTHFDEETYNFSNHLINNDTKNLIAKIEQNKTETQARREKINALIKRALYDLDIKVKYRITGKLTSGYAELVDTGSTARLTNQPGDTKFDFVLRLDRNIINTPFKMQELKQSILKYLGKSNDKSIDTTGDLKLTDVFVDEKTIVDINISFKIKTNAKEYYTNSALVDRLNTIEEQSIDKNNYKFVIANILLAKQILEEAEVYQPARSNRIQGGLGGVGIENWILQYGGSFESAAVSFLEASLGKTFNEFKKIYHIWDFGENILLSSKYLHDDYVNNMNEVGYEQMILTLSAYVRSQKEERFNSK